MSQINVNTITGKDGGSAVNFPNGITVTGVVTATSLNQTVNGNITATSFTGPLTGNATGLSGTPSITVGTIVGTDATLSGNLTVNGTTTTINTTNLQVQDAIIDTRHGNSVVAGTGGLRVVQTTDGSGNVTASREIRYNHTSSKWEFTEDGSTFKNLGSGGMGFSFFCGSF